MNTKHINRIASLLAALALATVACGEPGTTPEPAEAGVAQPNGYAATQSRLDQPASVWVRDVLAHEFTTSASAIVAIRPKPTLTQILAHEFAGVAGSEPREIALDQVLAHEFADEGPNTPDTTADRVPTGRVR